MKVRRVKISDIATVLTGGTPSTRNKAYWEDGNIPWLPSGVCQNCIVDHADMYITKEGLENSSAKMLEPNSVLIALTGATAGKVGLLSFEACANQSVTGILPNDFSVPKYLFHCLIARRDKTLQDCYGGAQPHISQGYVKNIEIPLPPLAEQKRIAGELDRICELKKNAEERLVLMDQLVKSKFVEMFGDVSEVIKIGDRFETQSGGTPKSTEEAYYDGGTIPWLTSGDVNQGMIGIVSRYITQAGFENSSAKWTPENSVLVAMYGATAGKVGLLKVRATTNQAVCSILPNEYYVPEYLYYAVSQKSSWMIQQAAGGAQPNISQGVIRRMEIPNPPLSLQREFAVFAESVDKSKAALRETIATMETLYKERLQEYFA